MGKKFMFAVALFMASLQISAQCGSCLGPVNLHVVNLPSGTWAYTIEYQGNTSGGDVCILNAYANPAIYGGNLPLNIMVADLLSASPPANSVSIPGTCYRSVPWKTVFDAGRSATFTKFELCNVGCCTFDRNHLNSGAVYAIGGSEENCDGGCHAICTQY